MMNQKSFKWTTLLVFFMIASDLAFGSADECTLCGKTRNGDLCDKTKKNFNTMALTQLNCKKCWACNQCIREMKDGILKMEDGKLVVNKDGKPVRGAKRRCPCDTVNNTQISNNPHVEVEANPFASFRNQLNQLTEIIDSNPLLGAVATAHKFAVSPRYQIFFPVMEWAFWNFQADKSMVLPQQVSNFLIICGEHQTTRILLVSGVKSFINFVLTNSKSQYVPYINGFLDAFLEGFIDYGTFVAMIFTLSGTVEITTIISIVGFLMFFKIILYDIKF